MTAIGDYLSVMTGGWWKLSVAAPTATGTGDAMMLHAYKDDEATPYVSDLEISTTEDLTTVAIYGRGRMLQIELTNYNGATPVELRALIVEAEVLPHE